MFYGQSKIRYKGEERERESPLLWLQQIFLVCVSSQSPLGGTLFLSSNWHFLETTGSYCSLPESFLFKRWIQSEKTTKFFCLHRRKVIDLEPADLVIVKSLEPFWWAETWPGCGQDHCIRHPHSSVSEWRDFPTLGICQGFKVVSHTSGKAHTQERCFSVASKEMLNSDYCVLGMGTLALVFTGADLWRPEMNIRFCETGSELGFSCHCLHGSCHACQ